MQSLDFLVIGAQKAGTTSFCHYIRSHPSVFVPSRKEIPFFCADERYQKGWKWYAKCHYHEAAPKDRWGKVTPQYMGYTVHTPQRISETIPDVKLIALLRNPIDRAFSHYRMTERRGIETRSFEEAVDDLLQEGVLREARQSRLPHVGAGPSQVETQCYLAWREYGRILGTYLDHFNREQLQAFYSDNLKNRPHDVLSRFFSFIGVDDAFTPSNLGKQYHVRTQGDGLNWLRRKKGGYILNGLRAVSDQFPTVKSALLSTLSSARETYWRVRGRESIAPDVRQRLRAFFRPDVHKLESLLGERPPWPEFCSDG